jgi:biotin-dependent carboxylase-like uncharacterized protein
MLVVLRAGPMTTVQDRGRPGLAHLGVPPSGAADRDALDLGNRVVGNPPDAAALETTLIGPALRFDAPAVVALTGAGVDATLAGRRVAAATPFAAAAGDVLDVGRAVRGARAYVCLRGGIDAERTLGSASTDLLTGLGPPPLRDGDVLRVGPEPEAPAAPAAARALPDEPVLRVRLGPRDDWFEPAAAETLVSAAWRVSPASNRVGARLEGPRLERLADEELLSEGVATGSLQVPPSGQPILLLVDHPTTGGYPVIAVVAADDIPLAGQLAPGTSVRFAA